MNQTQLDWKLNTRWYLSIKISLNKKKDFFSIGNRIDLKYLPKEFVYIFALYWNALSGFIVFAAVHDVRICTVCVWQLAPTFSVSTYAEILHIVLCIFLRLKLLFIKQQLLYFYKFLISIINKSNYSNIFFKTSLQSLRW